MNERKEDSMCVDFNEIKKEFLKYAPSYAKDEAEEALDKVMELQQKGILRNGVYYFVLVDLVGSTAFGIEHGNGALQNRIRIFILTAIQSIKTTPILNTVVFLKEIGDAVLLVFHHFLDIIVWRINLQRGLLVWSGIDTLRHDYVLRTCIHVGELSLSGVNPVSLAVSQVFKMEKSVNGNEIVLTEPAYQVAWPTLACAYHGFSRYKDIHLDGFTEDVKLYKLNTSYIEELEQLLAESKEE